MPEYQFIEFSEVLLALQFGAAECDGAYSSLLSFVASVKQFENARR